MGCRLIQVLICDDLRKGAGTEDDPVRVITRYYTINGDLIAEIDPFIDGDRYYNPRTFCPDHP